LGLGAPGLYQISGLAWSGAGRVRRVAVSADGGRSWADAALEMPVQDRCLTRFRAAWRWNGAPAVLQSRAEDETGAVQPTRTEWLAANGPRSFYHYNAVQAWAVAADGSVSNVFA
ncbi:MAG: sulfite dehydrogenase, partial [Pseudomonadales bacterium]